MSGDNITYQYGVYGIKGVANATNKPGARDSPISWTDASGNLWLFGGFGYTANARGFLNDLWKYNVATGQWTWIGGSNAVNQTGSFGTRGVANAANIPPGRNNFVGWTDASDNFWLFGGSGYTASGSGSLNDLWKYAPATNQWTWMSGDTVRGVRGVYGIQGTPAATNKPGARTDFISGSTADAAGNLWLFGGLGLGASSTTDGLLNDLWKYTISTGQWTWVDGANVSSQTAVYGTKGMAAASNRPGGRSDNVGWTDISGNFWLFGNGNGFTDISKNDLWRYDVSTGQWTWMSGDSTISQNGIYGTRGVANSTNTPGARDFATAQRDRFGNLLLFGGWGRGGFGSTGYGQLNDLWSYSPVSRQWTWLSGDSTLNSAGQYGIKGTSAPANKPGSRVTSSCWIDPSNHFWVFGGYSLASSGTQGWLNDLWRYTLSSSSTLGTINGFTAQKESQAVTLSWTSSPDQTIRSFAVERYNGAVTGYQSIGTVPATANSARYSFTDNTPLLSTNFYRIRQIDQAGSAAYSSTAQVDMSQYATQFSIYKNPVQNTLQLVMQLPVKQKLILQVRDMSGHVLIQQEQTGYAGRGSFAVPVEHLNKGTYLIQVQSESINSTKTFVKQ